MTDTNKLKELAERATPGRNFDRLPSAGGGLKYTCTGDDGSLVLRVDHKNDLFGFIGPKGEEDEAFFLACTPQAILGLIAEVERLRGQVDHLINQHMPREPIPDMPGWTRVIDADRLKAENEALRQFAAEVYQVLGALDAPENILDNASDAASGAPLRHQTLLPFFAEDYEALRKDAERYRRYRQGMVSPAEFDASIDAALEGGGNDQAAR